MSFEYHIPKTIEECETYRDLFYWYFYMSELPDPERLEQLMKTICSPKVMKDYTSDYNKEAMMKYIDETFEIADPTDEKTIYKGLYSLLEDDLILFNAINCVPWFSAAHDDYLDHLSKLCKQ